MLVGLITGNKGWAFCLVGNLDVIWIFWGIIERWLGKRVLPAHFHSMPFNLFVGWFSHARLGGNGLSQLPHRELSELPPTQALTKPIHTSFNSNKKGNKRHKELSLNTTGATGSLNPPYKNEDTEKHKML